MSQSSLLVGLLAAAFLLYVAAKGRLPVYTGVLWGAKPKSSSGGGSGGGSGGSPISMSDAVHVAEIASAFI